jgi:hypothetical protein
LRFDSELFHHFRDEWTAEFEKSHTVHFYQSSSKGTLKVMKKKFYGNSYPAYVPLGMDHCPVSFNSERMF